MLIVIVALLFFMICLGWILFDAWEEAIMWRRGMGIAQSVALEGLRHKQLPPYTPSGYLPYFPGKLTSPDVWARLEAIAAANGLDPRWFQALAATNIFEGWNWVTVKILPTDRGLAPISATAVGFPTWTVGAGDEWFTDAGDVEGVTGLMPIGIQTGAIPAVAMNGTTTFQLRVAADLTFEAQPVGLPGGAADPSDHLRFLAFDPPPGNAVQGTPPPTVSVGDQVEVVFRQGPPGQGGGGPPGQGGNSPFEGFADLMSNLVGRVVILPILDGVDVVDFVLLRIEESVKVVTTGDASNQPPGQGGITPPQNPGHGGTPPGQGGTVPGLGPGVFLESVDVVFRYAPSRLARSTYRHPDQPLVDPGAVPSWGGVLRPSIWEILP